MSSPNCIEILTGYEPTLGDIKQATNAKVAIFACPFDLTHAETKGTTADDLYKFSNTEDASVEQRVKEMAEAGVSVIVAEKFEDLYTHFLNKYKIMGVRLTSEVGLRRLCHTLGAQAQAVICAPPDDSLGKCDNVFIKEIGDSQTVIFDKQSATAKVVTVIVKVGSFKSILDDELQKELLVNVQTQTEDNMNEMGIRSSTNEDKMNDNNNNSVEHLICCCNSNETEGLNVEEFPEGCKKRRKLLLENEEQQRDKDRNKALSPPSPKRNKEDKEEKKMILYLEEDEVVQIMKMKQMKKMILYLEKDAVVQIK
uniref:Uncharacterized protein n=1 Tax=Meloidogyne javanica TaxID=6303 RepID=A0A915MXV9_MELJA